MLREKLMVFEDDIQNKDNDVDGDEVEWVKEEKYVGDFKRLLRY